MKNNYISILDLADYLILRFQSEGIPLNFLKLHKLLYYIQAWHAVFFEKHPLFQEEPEAWVNGPVYRTIYDELKDTYNMYDEIIQNINNNDLLDKVKAAHKKLNLSESQEKFLEAVTRKYGFMPSEKLVYLSHAEAPWNEARQGFSTFERSTKKISIDSMYNYYNSRRV